jgi:hypothetical protein
VEPVLDFLKSPSEKAQETSRTPRAAKDCTRDDPHYPPVVVAHTPLYGNPYRVMRQGVVKSFALTLPETPNHHSLVFGKDILLSF